MLDQRSQSSFVKSALANKNCGTEASGSAITIGYSPYTDRSILQDSCEEGWHEAIKSKV